MKKRQQHHTKKGLIPPTFAKKVRGFTLIEMIVSMGVFTVVLSASIGALLVIVDSSRKAQTLQVASNTLSLVIEDMSRNLSQGRNYHCDKGDTVAGTVPFAEPLSCVNGTGGEDSEDSIIFKSEKESGVLVEYWLESGVIKKRIGGAGLGETLTNSDIVTINDLQFYVEAGETGDDQPRVNIVVRGEVGKDDWKTTFNVQTSVTQHVPK